MGIETKRKVIQNNGMSLHSREMIEHGDRTWDIVNGYKRKQILDEVGAEYNQINLLAAVVAEIIQATPELLDNPIIADSMSKFNRINEIRNG